MEPLFCVICIGIILELLLHNASLNLQWLSHSPGLDTC